MGNVQETLQSLLHLLYGAGLGSLLGTTPAPAANRRPGRFCTAAAVPGAAAPATAPKHCGNKGKRKISKINTVNKENEQ
jgi:hypothetical protein